MVALVKPYGRERILINSAADWGVSDALKVPKTVAAMRESGVAASDIETIVWHHPVAFFSQSGRLSVEELAMRPTVDPTRLWDGNAVLRGQAR